MSNDTATPEGRVAQLTEFVKGYGRNWKAITKLIGGNPQHDLQDYDMADASGSHPDDK